MARPKPGKGVGCVIVSPEDVMKFKTIELLLYLSNLPSICRHAGVVVVRLPHDLVHNEPEVTMDVKPLDPELRGDA
jgi:hypothetical protein